MASSGAAAVAELRDCVEFVLGERRRGRGDDQRLRHREAVEREVVELFEVHAAAFEVALVVRHVLAGQRVVGAELPVPAVDEHQAVLVGERLDVRRHEREVVVAGRIDVEPFEALVAFVDQEAAAIYVDVRVCDFYGRAR